MAVAAHMAASGRIWKLKRIMPYAPVFSRMPARMTEIGVGASTCASGSHVWNGNIGTLMAKPMNRPTKMILENAKPRIGAAFANRPPCPMAESAMMLKVCWVGVPSASTPGPEL